MTYDYKAACISRVGTVRSNNEDNFLFQGKTLPRENLGLKQALYQDGSSKDVQIFALFDGMGGEDAGELASYTSAQVLKGQCEKLASDAIQPRAFLSDSIQTMNDAVFRCGQEHDLSRSGTTVALFYFSLDRFYIGNVGDSRIYRYREHKLKQLSMDDIIYNPEVKNQKLTQYLGVDPDKYVVRAHVKKGTIGNRDIFLLCSDGLYQTVPAEEICKIIDSNQKDITVCAETLANAAEKNGGDDNCTVILIQFRRVPFLVKFLKNTE